MVKIRIGIEHTSANREQAVLFTMSVLREAKDWQEGQDALANHPTIGPWIRGVYGVDAIGEAQAIIREAEERLGDDLPEDYG